MPNAEDVPMSAPAGHGFLRWMVRIVALLCLGQSLSRLVNYLVFLLNERSAFWFPRNYGGPWAQRIYLSLNLSIVACEIAACIGALALLSWKRWGRLVLLLSQAGGIVLSLSISICWFIEYSDSMRKLRATTQFAGQQPSLPFMGWSMIMQVVDRSFFPLIVLLVLLQPEVARLWATTADRAFEVLPLPNTSPPELTDVKLPNS